MNKPYRLIKRKLALILVLLFSIESFAAVVGDNDGAAFITKAEFDSMKNDFQSQLDRYNSSLDNKIDGAIASYLSGVQIGAQSYVPFLVGSGMDCLIIDSDKINDLEWGRANLDCQYINVVMARSNENALPMCNVAITRRENDANYEIFCIDDSKKRFLGWKSQCIVDIVQTLVSTSFTNLTGVAMENMPPDGDLYMRWHGGYTASSQTTSSRQPDSGETWSFDVARGGWSDRLWDSNWWLWYATATASNSYNIGAWPAGEGGLKSLECTLKPQNEISFVFDSGFNDTKLWTLPFTSVEGKQQICASEIPNYKDYAVESRKKSWMTPAYAGMTTRINVRWCGRYQDNLIRHFSNAIWVTHGGYSVQYPRSYACNPFYEIFFDNQNLKGASLTHEQVSSSIKQDYATYGYTGALNQGFPLGLFNDGNVIEFDLDTTTIENDAYIAFSTTPFSNGTTSKVYLENVNNDSTIELTIDGTKQSKSVAKINPSKHKIKLTISTVNKVPVFWKMAYPSTMTKSPRKSFTIPKEYLLTS